MPRRKTNTDGATATPTAQEPMTQSQRVAAFRRLLVGHHTIEEMRIAREPFSGDATLYVKAEGGVARIQTLAQFTSLVANLNGYVLTRPQADSKATDNGTDN